jgi:branched-chain amino acid transport system permease protein
VKNVSTSHILGRQAWLLILPWGMLLLFPILFPKSYLLSVLIFAGIWAIMLIGFDVLVGYCGQLSLGHNAFFAIGAYITGILTVKYGVTFSLIPLITGVLFTLIVAWVIGLPSLRLKGYYLAIATLGFGLIINNFLIGFNELTGGASGLHNIPPFAIASLFSFDSDFKFYYLVWGTALFVFKISSNFTGSSHGRALRAIREDEIFASTMRIPVTRYKIQAFLYSAACASLAGSLYAHYSGTITPAGFGFMVSIQMVVMLFLGGRGTIWGGVVGALFLKMLSEGLTSFAVAEYELPISGIIFILVLLFLPKGILGGLKDLLFKWQSKVLAGRS